MSVDTGTIAALREALDDEFRARATYRQIIASFGEVRPFVNIVEAEDRHARALLDLFKKFGIEAPADTWADRVTAPGTLAEACRDGVRAELENDAMYERLLGQVTDPSVRRVLRRLQMASRERHLPAFQRCLDRETVQGSAPEKLPPGTHRRSQIRRRGC